MKHRCEEPFNMMLRLTHVCVMGLSHSLIYAVCSSCDSSVFDFVQLDARCVVFWMLAVLTLLLYLASATSDPGFIEIGSSSQEAGALIVDVELTAVDTTETEDTAVNITSEPEAMAFHALSDEKPTTRDRTCKLCQCVRPLRAKHCVTCKRCVRTHDHHCPWIANCVGESNRVWFFWFVVAQGIQACWVLEQGTRCFRWEFVFLGGFSVVASFALFLVPLSIGHLWLAATNITTWEYLRWRRIPYLGTPSSQGSPFSSSLLRNLSLYCCAGRGLRCASGWRRIMWAHCFDGQDDAERGGGHVTADGSIVWRLGAPHVPAIVQNRYYSCFFPP